MAPNEDPAGRHIEHYELSWADFDTLARGDGGADVIQRLRGTQRSRRKLRLLGLVNAIAVNPDLRGPMPNPEGAWDRLVEVQKIAPEAFQVILEHPYTGAWLAHTIPLVGKLRAEHKYPIWIDIGHVHALAAAAAIRAGLCFEARIPVRNGEAILPTLGMARLQGAEPWSVADVHADTDGVRVIGATGEVHLPADPSADGPGWWGLRRLMTPDDGRPRLEVRLDDLDPYRDLHEPVFAERLEYEEVEIWANLLDDAWELILECVPTLADGFSDGFDSLVPRPAAPFQYLSGSSSETFGSAVIARPPNAKLLASALVHEFQHSRLHALMQLVPLHDEDRAERFYTLWRNDPRPLGGVIHGIYAFFGMTAFWRALANRQGDRRAWFEFAYGRLGTWRSLTEVRSDPKLNQHGRRFLDGVADRLGPWREEVVPENIAALAENAAIDHYSGWRLRHMRPNAGAVALLTNGWLNGTPTPVALQTDQPPVSEPDGEWTGSRTELIRLRLDEPARFHDVWPTVPGAIEADLAYVSGQASEAADGYEAELESEPDSVTAWAGLGLARSAQEPTGPDARALITYPEVVRAVHREIRFRTAIAPAPRELARWIAAA